MRLGRASRQKQTASYLLAHSLLGSAALLLLPASAWAAEAQTPAAVLDEGSCAALASQAHAKAPVSDLRIAVARWQPAGTEVRTRDGVVAAPAHCLVEGVFGERPGLIGGPYRTSFRIRLPAAWNGRFLFSGGGGSNGVVGDALGFNGGGNRPALLRGYAVIAQDSGHDNDRNTVADHGGNLVFGHDPVARRDYGYTSLKQSYDVGRYLVRLSYHRESKLNLFWGCSKGGQEGMAFAQRFPSAFDGIVAMAPGFALPRAAVAEAWDSQQFAGILKARGEAPSLSSLKSAFSPAQFGLVGEAVLAACDALDGTRDGMINAIGQCTTARVLPELRKRQCAPGATEMCLAPFQIAALVRVMGGPRNRHGQPLYAPWAWDAGITAPGWRLWKTGLENGPPALNAVLGAGSLAAVFTTKPTPLGPNPEKLLEWQLAFNFDTDAKRIYTIEAPFTTSAWHDVGMHSSDLSAFRAHGGKMIVPHGMADPVFSALDTLAWWNAVNARNRGKASQFVRVFPVPGMNHCAGGPATDQFDSLGALEDWVIGHKAPDAISAKAGPNTPWPDRERPICPYPTTAVETKFGFKCLAHPHKS